jgi:hypothetical protein
MELDAVLAALLAWASELSGYPVPAELPVVQFQPHSYLVEHVCFGQPCEVIGWYDDAGVVHIDQRYQNTNDEFAASLIVHEFTHYLQHKNGVHLPRSCANNIAREHEAYEIQHRYIRSVLESNLPIRRPEISCTYPNAGTGSGTAR